MKRIVLRRWLKLYIHCTMLLNTGQVGVYVKQDMNFSVYPFVAFEDILFSVND